MTSPFDAIDLAGLRRRRTAKWTEFGPDVLPASVAEMDFPIAEPIRRSLLAAIERDEFGYAVRDTTALARVCAGHLARAYGWEVGSDRIGFVPDVLDGVAAALELVAAPGAAIVVPTPSFPPLFEVIEMTGRRCVEVAMTSAAGRACLDLAGIDAALGQGADTVLLCNPHNPTGRVFEAAELSALAELVTRRGSRVISNEVHAPVTFPGHQHIPYARMSPAAAAHSVTMTSASKGWNIAGLKCAQLVLTDDLAFERWCAQSPFAVGGLTPLAIAATCAAYQEGGPWHREVIDYLDGNRRLLAELLQYELPQVGYQMPEGTYLAWLDCRALELAEPASWFLEHAKVGLSAGAGFGAVGAGHLRLNFATSRDMLRRLVEAMGGAVRRHWQAVPVGPSLHPQPPGLQHSDPKPGASR